MRKKKSREVGEEGGRERKWREKQEERRGRRIGGCRRERRMENKNTEGSGGGRN